MGRDIRLALRRLGATPLFTIFAILSVAIGVAITTAVYSIVDAVFLRGLAVTPIPLICAAFFACYVPARSAAAVDSTVALRSE